MQISIFASIGCQNLGDELILKNEISILEDKYGENTQFIVFSYDPKNPFFEKENIVYKEYFPIASKNPRNIFKNIKNFFVFLREVIKSDRVVIGGGGLIYDNEKQSPKNPLKGWAFRTKIFRLFQKKIEFFRVGIDVQEKQHYPKVCSIFKKADSISVRDDHSYELLESLGIQAKREDDPVFFEHGDTYKKHSSLIKDIDSKDFSYKNLERIDLSGKKVGIALRRGYLSKHKENIALQMEEGKINELLRFIIQKGGSVVVIPHSFHRNDHYANDYEFFKTILSSDMLSKYKNNIHLCSSMEESYQIYKKQKIDICLAQRLHSIILCHVYQIPFIGINYSRKTKEVLSNLKIIRNSVS